MNKYSKAKRDQAVPSVPVACHVHSEWSYDAKWPLPAIAQAFSQRGYRVVLMTEHDRGFDQAKWLAYQDACAEVSSEKLLVVPGIEYSDASNAIHILTWGCSPFLGEGIPTSDLLEKVSRHHGLAVFAHPSRKSAWRLFDPAWTANLIGLELWNRKTDGWAPSPAGSILLQSSGLLPFASLDFHDRRQFFPLSMQIAPVGDIGVPSVLDALRSGRVSASACGLPLGKMLSPLVIVTLSAAEKARRAIARTTRMLGGWAAYGRHALSADRSTPR